MKSTIPIALVSLVLGIAIGWLAKPGETRDLAARDAPPGADATPGRKKPADNSSGAPASAGAGAAESKPDRRETTGFQPGEAEKEAHAKAKSQQAKMITNALKSKFDLRIEAIVQELDLDAEQKSELAAYFEEQLEIIGASDDPFMMGGSPDEEEIARIAEAMRGSGIGEHLAEHLSEEQREALAEYQERQEENAVEARALKNFAKVQSSLDLSGEQRDQVYEVMLEEAADWRNQQSDVDYVTREMMSAMGMEMDFGDMDMGSMMDLKDPESLEGENIQDVFNKLQEDQERRVNERVERMAPILNENQLARYRQSLEQGGGMLKMMLGAEGKGEIEVEIGE